jgi:hypothetical protein
MRSRCIDSLITGSSKRPDRPEGEAVGKFISFDSENLDRLIEGELNQVVRAIRQRLSGINHTILLTGGFGRGEGSGFVRHGLYQPLNDYDLLIINCGGSSAESLARERLNGLGAELLRIVSVKQVDLKCLSNLKAATPWPTVERYEAKCGHRVLSGKLPTLRGWPRGLLPMCEGTRYLRNRAFGLLAARLVLEGYGPWDDAKRAELAGLEINKAWIAIGDAWLLGARQYHFLYKQRLSSILRGKAAFWRNGDARSRYAAVVSAKLKGTLKAGGLEEMRTEWFRSAKSICAEFLNYEGYRLRNYFPDLGDYAQALNKRMPVHRTPSWICGMRSAIDNPSIAQNTVGGFRLLQELSDASFEWKDSEQKKSLSHRLKQSSSFLRAWHPDGFIADLEARISS